jgi:hypothetical protein
MIGTIIIILLICFIIIFKNLYHNEVTFIEGFDSNKYLVRNLPDKNDAANMLAQLRFDLLNFINEICEEMEEKTEDNEDNEYYKYIKMIQKKLPDSIIKESSANSEHTSYSINKGEELVFCLRSKVTNKLHDINDILYVAVHEIAHIGCPEIGHTPLFKKINYYLLNKATEKNLYKYENYRIQNKEYCGITLSSNILDIN